METAFASSPRLLPSAASSIDLEQPFNDRKKATSALTPAFAKYFYVSAWCFIVVGTVVGRALEKLNWCWAFYINFVVGGILAPLYLFLLPSVDPSPDTQYAKRLPRPDYIGAILLVGALNSLLVAISFGGTKYAWNSRQTIALFCVSGVLFLIYAIQQRLALLTTTADRMLRVHSFNKKALLLFILAAACNAAAFIPIYYLSTYFQFTSGDLVEDSHVRALPVRCVLSVTILVNQFLMLKFGYYQSWFLYTGQGSLAYLAVTILPYIDRNSVWRRNYGTEIVHIIGTGAYISAGYAVVQAVVDPVDISYAITFMLIAQIGGIALGLAISSAVFINSARDALTAILPNVPLSQIQEIISGNGREILNSLPVATRELALGAVMNSVEVLYVNSMYTGAVSWKS